VNNDTTAGAGNLRQTNKPDDTRPTGLPAFLIIFSLVAWAWEAVLVIHLWSAHSTQSRVPILYYLLPIAHLFPWLAAMQWSWKLRLAVRGAAINAVAGSICQGAISAILSGAYVALAIVEGALLSGWKS